MAASAEIKKAEGFRRLLVTPSGISAKVLEIQEANLPLTIKEYGVRFRKYADAVVWKAIKEGEKATMEICGVGGRALTTYIIVTKLTLAGAPDLVLTPDAPEQKAPTEPNLDTVVANSTTKIAEWGLYRFVCPLCERVYETSDKDPQYGFIHLNEQHLALEGSS